MNAVFGLGFLGLRFWALFFELCTLYFALYLSR